MNDSFEYPMSLPLDGLMGRLRRCLGQYEPLKVRQRLDDRSGHRLVGASLDDVAEQGHIQRGWPPAATVEDQCLALHTIERGGAHRSHLWPSAHLCLERSLADRRLRVSGQAAHLADRHALRAVGQLHIDGQLRRDGCVQLGPGHRADGGQFGSEVLVRLRHLVGGPSGEPRQRTQVFGHHGALGGETVDPHRREPDREPGIEASIATDQAADASGEPLCTFIGAVRTDVGRDEGPEHAAQVIGIVQRSDHLVGCRRRTLDVHGDAVLPRG